MFYRKKVFLSLGITITASFITICVFVIGSCSSYLHSWRSDLYPENWYPGYSDNRGRFLHDFSYAGYRAGEEDIPFVQGPLVDVTKHPYYADNTGVKDVTAVLQNALDEVGQSGGGVVYMPEGTYNISVEDGSDAALQIKYSNMVLRGDGKGLTKLVNTSTYMRDKSIIKIDHKEGMRWTRDKRNITSITSDINEPTKKIPVTNTAGYSIGDLVVLRSDVTEGFILEHNMEGVWNTSIRGPIFYRQIVDIDHNNDNLFIDAPIRYYLKIRDNARVYKVADPIEEVGIENFSIANKENINAGFEYADYNIRGTGAYEVNRSHAILIVGAINCWIDHLSTFRPAQNESDIHLLSNGILISHSRHVTVQNCDFQKSQYNGAGGNGYMYTLRSNDCLLKYNVAGECRHNYSFKDMSANGNVLYRCTGNDSKSSTDFHMHLSMANLFDNFNVVGDYIEAFNRRASGTHGQSTTQSVFWNTNGIRYHKREDKNKIIYSQQFRWGYIIGTRGNAPDVEVWGGDGTEPIDFVEGIGAGDKLQPESLYKDQLNKRMQRGEYTY